MKKVLRIIIIMVVFVILAIDFYGLWKYKLSGKKYVLETGSDDSSEDTYVEEDAYEDLTSKTISDDEVFFIKSISKTDDGYKVIGTVFEPYEVSKTDYTTIRNGGTAEILGESYKKQQIKSNNLIIKSTETSKSNYYINYNATSKKYVLKDKDSDDIVYKSTGKTYKIVVTEETAFVTVKNGKNTNKKIEDIAESYKSKDEPSEATAKISTSVLSFSKNGTCNKITETIRE